MAKKLFFGSPIDYNKPVDEWLKDNDENWKKIVDQAEQAKKEKTLIGRYIQEPMGDGYAVYVIYKVNKKSVRIRVVKGIGDDWVIPYWGEDTSIDMDYVEREFDWREFLANMPSK